jgi:hypothetical protein
MLRADRLSLSAKLRDGGKYKVSSPAHRTRSKMPWGALRVRLPMPRGSAVPVRKAPSRRRERTRTNRTRRMTSRWRPRTTRLRRRRRPPLSLGRLPPQPMFGCVRTVKAARNCFKKILPRIVFSPTTDGRTAALCLLPSPQPGRNNRDRRSAILLVRSICCLSRDDE